MPPPTDEHCYLCFSVLESHFHQNNQINSNKSVVLKERLLQQIDGIDEHYPLFVTWKIQRDRLRGCIGTFHASSPLYDLLPEYTLIAALRDTRFSPITHRELPDLHCTVSILHGFEDLDKWDNWEIGQHGINVKFKKNYRATFLPEVAHEQQWTKRQTIEHAIRKSGYNGSIPEDIFQVDNHQMLQIQRYASSTRTVAFDDYHQWKQSQPI